MDDEREIRSAHPLFRELRNGLLWHCTSPKEYFEIRACGFIKPNEAPDGKYGRQPSACQALGGVSLFDFTAQSEAQILEPRDKWQQFLGCAEPLTLILGINRNRLCGRLVAYPEIRDITRPLKCTDPIPWVEVCHQGCIPVSAITSYLLVCAADYRVFKKLQTINKNRLNRTVSEYAAEAMKQSERRSNVQQINKSPQFRD